MQHFTEFVRVRVAEGAEEEFLASRPGAIEGVRREIVGFVDAPVIAKVGDREWVDVWIYETEAQAQEAMERAADIPEFMRMATVSEVLSIEYGISTPM